MSKRTPEPWTLQLHLITSEDINILGPDGQPIATMLPPMETAIQNARLFVNAPKLLQVLKDLVEVHARRQAAVAFALGRPVEKSRLSLEGWSDEHIAKAKAVIFDIEGTL